MRQISKTSEIDQVPNELIQRLMADVFLVPLMVFHLTNESLIFGPNVLLSCDQEKWTSPPRANLSGNKTIDFSLEAIWAVVEGRGGTSHGSSSRLERFNQWPI